MLFSVLPIVALVVVTAVLWMAARRRLPQDAQPFLVYLVGMAVLQVVQATLSLQGVRAPWIPLAANMAQLVFLAPVLARWVCRPCRWLLPSASLAAGGALALGAPACHCITALDGLTALLGLLVIRRAASLTLRVQIGLTLVLSAAPAAILRPFIPMLYLWNPQATQALWLVRGLLLAAGFGLLARHALMLLRSHHDT